MKPVLTFLVLVLFILSFTACDQSINDLKKKVVYKGPLSRTSDVTTLISDSALLQIKLTAPLQLQYENGDAIYPKGVNLIFYDRKGNLMNTVTANYGKFDKQNDTYVIREKVVLENDKKNETLHTEELFWVRPKRQIYTEKFVTIQTEKNILKGTGLKSKQDFSDWEIINPTGIIGIQK